MGSDDLHHKRKARRAKDLARRKSSRAPCDRVLIVCEGAKTEPNYLRELIDCLKLSSTNVEVDGDSGSSPISVVRHAKRRYREERDKGDAFDRVFCVFDKDTHTTYAAAMRALSGLRPRGVFSVDTLGSMFRILAASAFHVHHPAIQSLWREECL